MGELDVVIEYLNRDKVVLKVIKVIVVFLLFVLVVMVLIVMFGGWEMFEGVKVL